MTTQLAEKDGAAEVRRYDLFIDGKFVPAASGKTFTSTNPANGETVCEVAEGDKADIDKASRRRAPATTTCGRRSRWPSAASC